MNAFLRKTIFVIFQLPFAICLKAGDEASASPGIEITPQYVDHLLEVARVQSPALRAAGVRVEAADSDVAAVRSWEDPTASFGIWGPTSRGVAASQQGNLVYSIDQKLPLFGRPELERKVAQAGATRERLAEGFETMKLRRDIFSALDNLSIAGSEADAAAEELTWIDATMSEIDHRYRVGRSSEVDWLKVQTERAEAADELTTKTLELGHAVVAMNRLLGGDLHAHWPRVVVPSLQPPVYYTESLVGAALAAEPQLLVLRQESLAAEAAANLTKRQRVPEVSVGLETREYSGDGGFREGMATVSFTVPWLNRDKHDSDWRRDQQKKRASELAAEDYALSVREELHHLIIDVDAARRKVVLFRDRVIPLTEQALNSAEAAWARNLGSLRDILEIHRQLIEEKVARDRALANQSSRLADVIFLTGSHDMGGLLSLAGTPTTDHDENDGSSIK